MKYEITSKQAYHETMVAIYKMMSKGESALTATELKKLRAMTIAAESYEDNMLNLQPKKQPATIVEAVEIKMFESRMTQAKLAEKMGLAQSKVSEILSGKRKPDISFLKGINKILKIDAEFILSHV